MPIPAQIIVRAIGNQRLPIPPEMYSAMVSGAEDPDFSYEIEAEARLCLFIRTCSRGLLYNLYGTDISAIRRPASPP